MKTTKKTTIFFLNFFFCFRLTANKVSDYCKLINEEEDGHMGDGGACCVWRYVCVWTTGETNTQKEGEECRVITQQHRASETRKKKTEKKVS